MKFLHFLCVVLVGALLWVGFPGTSMAANGKRDQDGYVLGGYGDNDPNIFRPSKMDGRAVRTKDSKSSGAKKAEKPAKAN